MSCQVPFCRVHLRLRPLSVSLFMSADKPFKGGEKLRSLLKSRASAPKHSWNAAENSVVIALKRQGLTAGQITEQLNRQHHLNLKENQIATHIQQLRRRGLLRDKDNQLTLPDEDELGEAGALGEDEVDEGDVAEAPPVTPALCTAVGGHLVSITEGRVTRPGILRTSKSISFVWRKTPGETITYGVIHADDGEPLLMITAVEDEAKLAEYSVAAEDGALARECAWTGAQGEGNPPGTPIVSYMRLPKDVAPGIPFEPINDAPGQPRQKAVYQGPRFIRQFPETPAKIGQLSLEQSKKPPLMGVAPEQVEAGLATLPAFQEGRVEETRPQ